MVDPVSGRFDTLPTFRRTLDAAGLDDTVVAVVGKSTVVAAAGERRCSCCSSTAATARPPHSRTSTAGPAGSRVGGTLLIHDVFPTHATVAVRRTIYCRALESGHFTEVGCTGSCGFCAEPGCSRRGHCGCAGQFLTHS